jgi:hypothetical protein
MSNPCSVKKISHMSDHSSVSILQKELGQRHAPRKTGRPGGGHKNLEESEDR